MILVREKKIKKTSTFFAKYFIHSFLYYLGRHLRSDCVQLYLAKYLFTASTLFWLCAIVSYQISPYSLDALLTVCNCILPNISLQPQRSWKISYLFFNLKFKFRLYASTVERLRLRLHICLNLTPVSIYLNFRLIVYIVETKIQQQK